MSDPSPQRDFAVDVVQRLKHAGFEALWAGGCVRDFLLGKTPKDYDVATNATPDEVRKLFGRRQTVPVGAAFGVIMVLGPTKAAGQIEVATFRAEGPYLDGRRPEHVVFCTPEEDARRRDFTINGMFYDPLAAKVLDFVGGEHDLAAGIVRAIGTPRDRMTEDKLRMLRAVRFAATLEFQLDAATAAAVTEMAPEIHIVSVERIAQELRRMLIDPHRMRAIDLAREVGLLQQILPETPVSGSPSAKRLRTLAMLHLLQEPTFELAFAILVLGAENPVPPDGQSPSSRRAIGPRADRTRHGNNPSAPDARSEPGPMGPGLNEGEAATKPSTADRRHKDDAIWSICRRLKLSNEEAEAITWLVANRTALHRAPGLTKAELKRWLVHPLRPQLLALTRADLLTRNADLSPVTFVVEYLAKTPWEQIDPLELITGSDLKQLGHPPGPNYKRWLDAIREAQLNEQISTKDEALELLQRLISEEREQGAGSGEQAEPDPAK